MVNKPAQQLTVKETMLSYYFFSSGQTSPGLVDVSNETVIEGLRSHTVQDYLSEAESSKTNGGPRGDQNFRFVCGEADRYPLHFAAMMGNVRDIHRLIKEKGIDPNSKCSHWFDVQPVWYAACYGQLHAVLALMKVSSKVHCIPVP